MAEAPEIPEASDPFEKRAAVTIAILAVVLAVIDNKGDNAKTDAIIKTNVAANRWAHYQAKSIKGSIITAENEMLTLLASAQTSDTQGAKRIEQFRAEVAKRLKDKAAEYGGELAEITKEAKEAEREAEVGSKINDRCDHGSLALQVAIVIASVAILARSQAFWIASIVLGLVGIAVGVTAFML